MRAFDVYRDGELIDTLFYGDNKTIEEEVKRSLVDHDGYPSDIRVKMRGKR